MEEKEESRLNSLKITSDLAELDYVVDDGMIVIGTKENLARTYKTQLYNISDLVNPPADY